MDAEGDSCNFDYNWDELSVGNIHMDHSNHFFVKTHPEHEKFTKNSLDFDKEFNNALPETMTNGAALAGDAESSTENRKENVFIQPQSADVQAIANSPKPKREIADVLSPNKNRKCDTKPKSKPMTAHSCDKDFNVVQYVKIYDVKKKAMMNAIAKMEREKRAFHSKPAPNFQAIHAAVERKRQHNPQRVTCPMTPTVLRRHEERKPLLEKHREEYEASLRPKPFVSNPDPEVLRKKPFVPQIEKCPIATAPFNLQSEARLKERRQFDENLKAENERRLQEKEEQRKRDEERVRKELRKATVFKAQPNPFK